MARPYKSYREKRAAAGAAPYPHEAARYNRWRDPVIAAVATPGAALAVTLAATAVVPDGSEVTLSVDWENDGTFVALAAPEDFEHTYGEAGEKTIAVKAVAADGFNATKTLTVIAAA